MKKFFFLFIALITLNATINAQHINFKVVDIKTADPEVGQQMEGLFKTMKMDVYHTPQLTMSELDMMNGMSLTRTYVTNDGKTIIFSEMMGNKTKVIPTDAEVAEMKAEAEANAKNVKITEVSPAQTKTILGYNCKKYMMTSESMNMEMYVAPELNISSHAIQGLQGVKIDGFPLEYIVDAGGNKLTFRADKVNTVSYTHLTLPTKRIV